MNVTIIGAGAAGLGAATMLRGLLNADVTILERAREGEAPGLGVALLPFALDEVSRLLKFPYRTARRDAPGRIRSEDLGPYADAFIPIPRAVQVFAGTTKGDLLESSRVQSTQYWGVKRATLLAMLTGAARNAGVKIEYGRDLTDDAIRHARKICDLLIGADGAGSAVRNLYAEEFGPKGEDAKSRYAWLELEGSLDRFVFGYVYVVGKGLIRVTAYPHSRTSCSAIVTHSMGLTNHFDEPDMLDAEGSISERGMQTINEIFARVLGGRTLSGKSRWRRFRATHCQNAAFGNVALVGDAQATLHFETGWGTSVAIQASSILVQALQKADTVTECLEKFNAKATEVAHGAITATLRSMRQVDGQAAKFYQLGAAKFLTLSTA